MQNTLFNPQGKKHHFLKADSGDRRNMDLNMLDPLFLEKPFDLKLLPLKGAHHLSPEKSLCSCLIWNHEATFIYKPLSGEHRYFKF